MGWMAYPTLDMSHEEFGIASLRDAYLNDLISLAEFEHRVGCLLAGDMSVVPMGGLPPPKTGQPPETR